MNKREKLTKELQNLRKQISGIRDQIDKIDYDKKYSNALKYKGLYYKQATRVRDKEYIRCVFVYDVDKESCGLKSIEINYWEDSDHFTIEYYHYFKPDDKDDYDKWEEISKKEFEMHYNKVKIRCEQLIMGLDN